MLIYLKGRQRNLLSAVSLSYFYKSQGWAKMKLGIQNSIQVSHKNGRGPKFLGHHLLLCQMG